MSTRLWSLHVVSLSAFELPEMRAARDRHVGGDRRGRADMPAAIGHGLARLFAHRAVRDYLNELRVDADPRVRLIVGVPRATRDRDADVGTMDALVHALWRDEPVPS